MPIIDLQRRLREVGRIRLGEQVRNKSGNGTHPAKLEKFRFTSADKYAIDLVAKAYGGEVQPWAGAAVGTQWELYTDSTNLDVLVPPVDLAFGQWMELWSGGGCLRRCNRQINIIDDSPCACDPDLPECKPTTHLGVILTGVDGIGIWRLSSHGWAAATELNGAIEVLRVVQNRGAMVPARLLLEQRQQKKIVSGKPETFNFAVPVLDLSLDVAALTGARQAAQITPGATPIDATREALPTIAEQVAATETPTERPRRANAAATLPSTGIKPPARGAAKPAADDRTEGGASVKSVRRVLAILNGDKNITSDADRFAWAEVALGHPVTSFNKLTQQEISKLNDVAEGKAPLVADAPQKLYADDDNERPF